MIDIETAIKDLIEARKLFNELSDKVYAIAEGDLDNSKYGKIYMNFEDTIRREIAAQYYEREDFIDTYFCLIILDMAQYGTVEFTVDNKPYRAETVSSILWLLGGDSKLEMGHE